MPEISLTRGIARFLAIARLSCYVLVLFFKFLFSCHLYAKNSTSYRLDNNNKDVDVDVGTTLAPLSRLSSTASGASHNDVLWIRSLTHDTASGTWHTFLFTSSVIVVNIIYYEPWWKHCQCTDGVYHTYHTHHWQWLLASQALAVTGSLRPSDTVTHVLRVSLFSERGRLTALRHVMSCLG